MNAADLLEQLNALDEHEQLEAKRGEDAAVLESVKAASDVYAPVSGVVAEVNDILEMEPDLINRDTYGKGWILKLKDVDVAEYEDLMDSRSYRGYLKTVEQ